MHLIGGCSDHGSCRGQGRPHQSTNSARKFFSLPACSVSPPIDSPDFFGFLCIPIHLVQTLFQSHNLHSHLTVHSKWARTKASLLVTLRRVPSSSRPVALSATLSSLAVPTRSAPTSTVSSAVRPVPPRDTPTPTPTSRPVLPGTRTLCSPTLRTPRSSSPVPRWPSVV